MAACSTVPMRSSRRCHPSRLPPLPIWYERELIDTLYNVVAFAITLGLLVVFPDLGHYVVARLSCITVLLFSVVFGRMVLSRRYGRDGTEWSLSPIPLGGCVNIA